MAAPQTEGVALVPTLELPLCHRDWRYPVPENGHVHVCDAQQDHGSEVPHRCAVCNARLGDLVRWFDHQGNVVEIERPPNGGRATAYRWDDGYNHWLFGDPAGYSAEPRMQALTYCGRRALEVPGRGWVDCPECVRPDLPAVCQLDDCGCSGPAHP